MSENNHSMNPILSKALIDEAARELADLAINATPEDVIYRRDQLRQQYKEFPDFLEHIETEWPFVMLAMILENCRD